MDRNKRIEYLITTLCIFVSGFILYGLMGISESLIGKNKIISFLIYGLLGGFSLSMVLSTIMIAVNFFNKKSIKFKILASILWPITVLVLFYIGAISYIPYQIYNIIQIVKKGKLKN